ncbi:MAG: putative membrane protein [Luteibaculaceae bacterium]|jgi:uncharacterized membrane protein
MEFPFNRTNIIWILSGLGLLVLGYLLMSGGGSDDPNVFTGDELFSFRRITLAPLMVVAGYVIIFLGILKKTSA